MTVKLNATTRSTLLSVMPHDSELRSKVLSHGIMDPIDLTADELAALYGYAEYVGIQPDTHWANGRVRIRTAFRETIDA